MMEVMGGDGGHGWCQRSCLVTEVMSGERGHGW